MSSSNAHARLKKVTELIKENTRSFSFEVTPDVSLEAVNKLSADLLFFSVTWHSRKHGCESLDVPPLQVAKELGKKGKQVVLHLACDSLRKNYLDNLLNTLQESGICNLFVFLGEVYDENTTDFRSTKDLIKYIREKTGDYFCIGVAAFPKASDDMFQKLKEKIDAGGNFIITQALFDADVYKNFVNKCEGSGIKVPILAGILFFDNYDELVQFTNDDNIVLQPDMLNKIKNTPKTESKAVLKKIITDIRNIGFSKLDIHIFTMNKLEGASTLIKEIT